MAMMPSVKRIFFRRSGVLSADTNALSNDPPGRPRGMVPTRMLRGRPPDRLRPSMPVSVVHRAPRRRALARMPEPAERKNPTSDSNSLRRYDERADAAPVTQLGADP